MEGLYTLVAGVALMLERLSMVHGNEECLREFGIKNYSTASSVVQRVKLRTERDRRLQRELDKIANPAELDKCLGAIFYDGYYNISRFLAFCDRKLGVRHLKCFERSTADLNPLLFGLI